MCALNHHYEGDDDGDAEWKKKRCEREILYEHFPANKIEWKRTQKTRICHSNGTKNILRIVMQMRIHTKKKEETENNTTNK